jgi:tetratricopeptide (TPR) repeat protein
MNRKTLSYILSLSIFIGCSEKRTETAVIYEDSSGTQQPVAIKEEADPAPLINQKKTKNKKTNVVILKDTAMPLIVPEPVAINYYEDALKKFHAQDYAGCIFPFDKELEKNPVNKDAYYKRGQAKMELGDNEGAIKDFIIVINLDPSNYEVLIKKGYAELNMNEYANAKNDLTKALKYLHNLEAYMTLADIKFKMSDYTGAIQDYTDILDHKLSDSFEVYYKRGLAKAESGRYEEAIMDFGTSVNKFPKHAYSYYHKGLSEMHLEKYKEAAADFGQVVKIHPKDKSGYYHRGVAENKLKDFKNSIKDFTQVIEMDPSYEEAYFQRAEALGSIGKISEAISDLNKVIELNGQSKEAYYNRGQFYLEELLYDRAIEDFSKVIMLAPGDAEAYYFKGTAEMELKKFSEACASFQKASEFGEKKGALMAGKACKN